MTRSFLEHVPGGPTSARLNSPARAAAFMETQTRVLSALVTHFDAEFHSCLSIGPRSARPRPEFQLVSGQRLTLWRPDCLVYVEFSFSTHFLFFKRLAIFTIQPALRATPSGNSPGPKADSCPRIRRDRRRRSSPSRHSPKPFRCFAERPRAGSDKWNPRCQRM